MSSRRREKCQRNHPFTRENTYLWTDRAGVVHRKCAKCAIARQKNYRESLRGTTK